MSRSPLAPRMARVRPSPTAAISDTVRALAARGIPVINLGEGELDFDTPAPIKAAGIAAIERGETKYTAVAGTAALKAAIAAKFRDDNGLAYAADEIIAGSGAKQLIFNALLATVSDGDEVIVPAPYWVSYPDMVALCDGTPVIVPCRAEAGWKLTPETLADAITPRTRWLILNSPNNPTGAVYSEDEIAALTAVLRDHPHVLVMADDIYEHVRHDTGFATPAAVAPDLKDRTLTVNGVSKAYSMTGWRIGYAGGPAWLIAAMTTLQSQSTSNPSSVSQAATIAALEGSRGFMNDWLARLKTRRQIVLDMVDATDGLTCDTPEGAFYAFVGCGGLIGRRTPAGRILADDLGVATYLLEEAHVAMIHGAAFGASPNLRIAYAVDDAQLAEACRRIAAACGRLQAVAAAE
ncbi:pyridoxal phosphate-dependent aminotransferase [Methylobrevis pamukkalensis]|uniref:Aminotransferase n=1 Tax=Methylobrevis pamukkalensis TaxID=1439726 RepID=A0A1E3H4I2_9HYPH|nr:pyridoxal phosphate-dependent aminotransferase [Methylobrevis pamukkalensis]ODN71222.1 Aspartate aminotransferase [Methylobrevis pamukkalensis]